ncbi:mechanosensitive ion channel domain-containing protein [Ulvibacterium marinum]|uniref:Mechanosensitive ion channel family protein n=1 Tax=Ulvibacterium marinum TaxID=2419782 RepID=A0A3B0C913_9FLAO|nr:mechanosensitive ion channel domain-containing protein [Ulvibacterium marinum]RKN80864.1 mechanosensitive ion channel family protein [Ulvibacterium marinum]
MENIFFDYRTELIATLATLVVLLVLRFIFEKAIRKVGKISDLNRARTLLIIKYVSIAITIIGVVALTLIWGVNIKDLGLIFSSVFAVIGVALFAQWSIISNITAGVILFFSFPYKIGDRIRIMDKDIADKEANYETYLIEDIKAYHMYLRKDNGELLTYPNNLLLQKAVALIDATKEIKGE